MDTAATNIGSSVSRSEAHVDSRLAPPVEGQKRKTAKTTLADDIDDLRRKMAETFLKEASFTADPVILISRQLDLKINEYMKQWNVGRKKAR